MDVLHQNSTPQNGRAPAGKTVKTVTGQFIAKATVNYSCWGRAWDAARWLRGELQIVPTVKLAAKTFGVSIPLVAEARTLLERRDRAKRHTNGGGSIVLSDFAIDNIVVEIGPERVMRSLDRITSPQLPPVAAE
jgi:hypothetical protein